MKKRDEETELYDLAELFKVFGDTTRIRILFVLFEREVCVYELAEALSMTQSAISHQLRLLKQMHLIKYVKNAIVLLYIIMEWIRKQICQHEKYHFMNWKQYVIIVGIAVNIQIFVQSVKVQI